MCSLHTFPFLLCLPFELSSKCPSAYGRFFATLSADCLCRHLQIHRGNSKYENMTTLEDWTVLPKLTSESSVWQTNCLPWWLLPLVVNETHKHRCRIISVMISPSFSACRSSPPLPCACRVYEFFRGQILLHTWLCQNSLSLQRTEALLWNHVYLCVKSSFLSSFQGWSSEPT